MGHDALAAAIHSIDLLSPGVPRRIQECYIGMKSQFSDGLASLLESGAVDATDERLLMLVAMALSDTSAPGDTRRAFLEAMKLPTVQEAEALIEQGLFCIMEYSWPYGPDPDAVEYHYWACTKLLKLRGETTEGLMLTRLRSQPDIKRKCSLVCGLGVLSHVQFLHKLSTESVEQLVAMLNDIGQPEEFHECVREVLAEDVLRTDQENHYLAPSLRQVVELSLQRSERGHGR